MFVCWPSGYNVSKMDRAKSNKLGGKQNPVALVPLSEANLHILLTLAAGEEHGYAIMQQVRHVTESAVRLGPGTLYRCLKELLQDKLIEESPKRPDPDEDQRRRYYRLTALGRAVLSAESRRLANVVALARRRGLLEAR